MAYRPAPTGYLIRDPKKDDNTPEKEIIDEDEESERIEVDDEMGDFVGRSNERSEEMEGVMRDYKKKYTFTQRKSATIYHCHECNKVFKHPSKISEHLRKHNGQRPFLCEVCGARFTQKGSLKVHERAHLGQLPYKCTFCNRHFSTPYNQKVHEGVHIRGGRLHRDRRDNLLKEGEARLKLLAAASADYLKREGRERERREEKEGIEEALYECCVENCGYQHTNKEMVERHIEMQHADIWDEEEIVEGVEEEEVVEGEEGVQYQNYGYYEYVEHEQMMDGQEEVVMTEDELAVVTAANAEDEEEEEEEHVGSSSTDLPSHLPLHSSMGIHENALHPSTSSGGNALMIEADEHIDEDSMRKAMSNDGRTKRLLTLGSTGMAGGMVKEEMYPVYSAETPLASYEVEVITSRDGNGIVSSRMEEEEEEEDMQPVFSELTRAQLIEEMEPVEGTDRVRVWADRRPPTKGRRSVAKWEDEQELVDYEMDRSQLEQVMAQHRFSRNVKGRRKRNGPPSRSRNLDWIIDAVATGIDVDAASPHNRKKPQVHTCVYCGKVDKYPSKIEAHLRTHTGEKPYKCEICGVGFAQKTPLRMHMRRHLNDRAFACPDEECGAKFVSQALLNAHMSSRHCTTKRFVCMKGCGRCFANGRNQRQHELKCNHIINRTTINTDYNVGGMEGRYGDAAADDGDGEGTYLEEEDEVDDDDEYGGHHEEEIHLDHHPHHSHIRPPYL